MMYAVILELHHYSEKQLMLCAVIERRTTLQKPVDGSPSKMNNLQNPSNIDEIGLLVPRIVTSTKK